MRAIFQEARAREAGDDGHEQPETPEQHTGLMVACFVPPTAAKRLAVPGGEPVEDLHVTLAFLGEQAQYTASDLKALRRFLSGWAAEHAGLRGRVSGVEQFPVNPASGTYPVYAAVDIPAIQAWRAQLVAALDAAGFLVEKTFATYVPHITLAYVPKGESAPVDDVPAVPLAFNTLWLAAGDERYAFPLNEVQPVIDPVASSGNRIEGDPLQRLADALAARVEQGTQQALRELRTQVLAAIES